MTRKQRPPPPSLPSPSEESLHHRPRGTWEPQRRFWVSLEMGMLCRIFFFSAVATARSLAVGIQPPLILPGLESFKGGDNFIPVSGLCVVGIISFLGQKNRVESRRGREEVAERKGRCCHLAAFCGARNLVQPHHRQDRLHLVKKRSCFLLYLPQGKTNSLWHFPAFLIFNSTVVGGWPWWTGMEKFSTAGANLPTAG